MLLRRTTRVLAALAGFGVVAAGLAGLPASPAYAGGAFAPVAGETNPVTQTGETAIVSLALGQEQIDMRLSLTSLAKQTGYIIATPTPATVTMGSTTDFSALLLEMTPATVNNDVWFSQGPSTTSTPTPHPSTTRPPSTSTPRTPTPTVTPTSTPTPTDTPSETPTGSTTPTTSPSTPTTSSSPSTRPTSTETADNSLAILDRVQLGALQATTLDAKDPKALTTWLTKNKYELSDATSAALATYVEMGWSFVAMRLISDQPLTGDLAPIRITFTTDQMVYPLILNRLTTTPQTLNLYVIASHRTQVAFADGSPVVSKTPWAGPVKNITLKARGAFLTAFEMSFPKPATDITNDLAITRAPTDDEVGTIVVTHTYLSFQGYPLGWVIVAVSVFIGFVVLLITFIPRRRAS